MTLFEIVDSIVKKTDHKLYNSIVGPLKKETVHILGGVYATHLLRKQIYNLHSFDFENLMEFDE
jgi:hypothetical protein